MCPDSEYLYLTLRKIGRFPVFSEVEQFCERVSIRIDSGSSVSSARLDTFHDLFVDLPFLTSFSNSYQQRFFSLLPQELVFCPKSRELTVAAVVDSGNSRDFFGKNPQSLRLKNIKLAVDLYLEEEFNKGNDFFKTFGSVTPKLTPDFEPKQHVRLTKNSFNKSDYLAR